MNIPYETAVITGASSGIGRALAVRLAASGVKVALLARRMDKLQEAVESIRASGGEATAIACDVTDANATRAAVNEARKVCGPIDLLIVSAGIGRPMTADRFELDTFEQTYRVNVFGAIHAIASVLPEMIRRRAGHIVGVSSLASYRAYPGMLGYSGTKAALNHELEAIRNRVHQWNIDVTTICPGFIRTEMTERADIPQPFRMELEPAADRMYRAILRRRKFYSFPQVMAWCHRLANVLPPVMFDPFARASFTP